MPHRSKSAGLGLRMKTFTGKRTGKAYLVFRTTMKGRDSFHVFVEVSAREAARDCGAEQGHTIPMWKKLWDESE